MVNYLTALRIGQAKRLIQEGHLNLARQEIFLGGKASSICIQCGFSDYPTFFRAYKKQFGYPPPALTTQILSVLLTKILSKAIWNSVQDAKIAERHPI